MAVLALVSTFLELLNGIYFPLFQLRCFARPFESYSCVFSSGISKRFSFSNWYVDCYSLSIWKWWSSKDTQQVAEKKSLQFPKLWLWLRTAAVTKFLGAFPHLWDCLFSCSPYLLLHDVTPIQPVLTWRYRSFYWGQLSF